MMPRSSNMYIFFHSLCRFLITYGRPNVDDNDTSNISLICFNDELIQFSLEEILCFDIIVIHCVQSRAGTADTCK